MWSWAPEIGPLPASRNAVAGLTLATAWIQPFQQAERHVDGGKEQDQEHGGLHQRARLDRAEAKRDPRRPAVADEHEQRREAVQAEQVDPVPVICMPASSATPVTTRERDAAARVSATSA